MKLQDIVKSEPQLHELLLGMPEEISKRSHLKSIAAGTTIIGKGEKVKYVYFLVRGEVKVINEFENGRMYNYARINSLSFIGELEILAGEVEYASTIEAVSDCKLLVITAEDFTKWIASNQLILMMVAKGLAQKMYPTSSQNGMVKFLPGIRKVQAFIIKYYKEQPQDLGLLPIARNRQQIADEIGISVKTVNRCVEKLKLEGLISIKRGKIYITKEQYNNLISKMDLNI